jgi:hypothetical protein
MKNNINILLIIFCSMLIGNWGELVELSTNDAVPVATKMNENSEKEVDNEAISYFEGQGQTEKTGQGGNKFKTVKAFVLKAQVLGHSLVSLVSPNKFTVFDALKTNNDRLVNSIKQPKRYILFHCFKAFLA